MTETFKCLVFSDHLHKRCNAVFYSLKIYNRTEREQQFQKSKSVVSQNSLIQHRCKSQGTTSIYVQQEFLTCSDSL